MRTFFVVLTVIGLTASLVALWQLAMDASRQPDLAPSGQACDCEEGGNDAQ